MTTPTEKADWLAQIQGISTTELESLREAAKWLLFIQLSEHYKNKRFCPKVEVDEDGWITTEVHKNGRALTLFFSPVEGDGFEFVLTEGDIDLDEGCYTTSESLDDLLERLHYA